MKDRPVGDNTLHPRLTVAWASGDRVTLHGSLAPGVAVVTADAMERRLADVAASRREHTGREADAREAQVRSLGEERDVAAATADELSARYEELRDSAEWCAHERSTAARLEARERELVEEIDAQGQTARAATRQLERVLEQRAAAEQALADARSQLGEMGAVGVDETGVRRQLEQASSELRAASADYRNAMTEVARRRAHLDELEAVSAGTVEEIRVDDSQLDLMRAALDAKYRSGSSPTSGAAAIDAARTALEEAEAAVERGSERLAAARQRIASFEQELARRTDGSGGDEARRHAAAALEAQVASVEQRLAEAEGAARDEADDATRALARAEHELERLRDEVREHRRRLQALAVAASTAGRPSAAADDGALAALLAEGLRADAHAVDAELQMANARVDDLDRRLADAELALAETQADGPDGIAPIDRRAGLRTVADEATVALVLDDCVGPDGPVLLDDLEDLDAEVPVVVLTTDPAVVSWAIELPGDRGAVGSAHAVQAELGHRDHHRDHTLIDDRTIRPTMECSP